MNSVIVGNYALTRLPDGKLYLRDLLTEEGGTFDEGALGALLAQFFKEHF